MGIRTRNALTFITEVKLRLDRGNSLIYWAKNIILGIAALKVIFDVDSYFILSMMAASAVIIVFILGHIDLQHIKLYQKENELNSSKYNPILAKLEKLK